MKSRPPRSRQSVTDSLFGLGGQSGTPEGFAALGAARLGPGSRKTGAGVKRVARKAARATGLA